jgi:hypothetical protein
MKLLAKFCLLFVLAASLAACQTTGDPNRGGIFWSESKANERLKQKQDELNSVKSDTARIKGKNAAMEADAARKGQAPAQ